jgi:hypothetical protein
MTTQTQKIEAHIVAEPLLIQIISKAIFTIQTKKTIKITAGTHNIQLGTLLMIDFFSLGIFIL